MIEAFAARYLYDGSVGRKIALENDQSPSVLKGDVTVERTALTWGFD